MAALWWVGQALLRAEEKFLEFDTDCSGTIRGDEVLNIANWVWQSFHPNKEPLEPKEVCAAVALWKRDTKQEGIHGRRTSPCGVLSSLSTC